MKPLWIGTSWKMNKIGAEADRFASRLAQEVNRLAALVPEQVQPFVIPPFPYIQRVSEQLAATPVKVGAQNMCWDDAGAYTGEVSPLMLRDIGAHIVELGHSERRTMFGETDETVNCKVHAALRHGLTPLVCIGDSADEKRWGVSIESVVRQVKIALHGLSAAEAAQVILAYEPVWAIGEHGVPATAEEAEAVHAAIRQALVACYGEAQAEAMVLLYGGSVNQQNAATLLSQPNVDGLFVGRSAWPEQGFAQLLDIAQRCIEPESEPEPEQVV